MKRKLLQISFGLLLGLSISLSYGQLIPVKTSMTMLSDSVCSSTFVAHSLQHQTTVPGGNNIRMFEANGGGVAINDLDNDGDLDIVLANHADSNSILWNEGNLTFRKEPIGVGDARAAMIVDVGGDGWQDIVFSRRVTAPNYWKNQKGKGFEQVILEGVSKPLYAINWADIDGDTDLDLVGASYDAGLLTEFGAEFLNRDIAGVYVYINGARRFQETRLSHQAQALALILIDINQDQNPDILVGNDFAVPDMAWLNMAGAWESVTPFEAMSHSTMSFDAGDINNDGIIEIFSTDMKPYPNEELSPWVPIIEAMTSDPKPKGDPQVMENVLQEWHDGSFKSTAITRGIDATGWSWSGKFADFNQDGFLDLYVVNGMMEQSTFAHVDNHELVEVNQAFKNDGTGMFTPAPEWGLGSLKSGRGMSIADLDADGDLDIVINNLRGESQLFENQLCTGTSLQVDLNWQASRNPKALGASLIVHTNENKYHRDLIAGTGYLSGNSSRIHFGLPENERIEQLEIIWPDGMTSEVNDIKPNSLLQITRERD